MSPSEVTFRLNEQIKRIPWRYYQSGWGRFKQTDGPLPQIPEFRSNLTQKASPCLRSVLFQSANDLQLNPLKIFDQQWGKEPVDKLIGRDPLVFHLDPISNLTWPRRTYCFDISHRHAKGLGDYKYCAEFNQLQFCHTLAAAASLDKSSGLAERVINIWRSWYLANPPFFGVAWLSGINLALRIISLIVTTSLIDVQQPDDRVKLRTLLNAHGYWLARYPSLHSSANNHLIAESACLFILGMLAPDLPNATNYSAIGRRRLEDEISKQILSDGVGAEMSPTYTSLTIEWYLLAIVVAEKCGTPLSEKLRTRLAVAAEHFKAVMDAEGHVPAVGDNDDGRVISSTPNTETKYVASITSGIAGVLRRPDLAPTTTEPSLRDILFDSIINNGRRETGIRSFNQGGLTAIRDNIRNKEIVLVFDHGPVGYLSIAAHGHADTLSIWLSVDAHRVLVDAGTYVYHGDAAWRSHFRSTRSHNTVEVNRSDSSLMAGAFNWKHKASARILELDSGPMWRVSASHDGYVRRFGVRHVRTIERTSAGFSIKDSLVGQPASARIGFLVNPEYRLRVEGTSVFLGMDRKEVVEVVVDSRFQLEIVSGREAPAEGWYSDRFGVKKPAPRITLSGRLGANPLTTEFRILSSE
jgi:hypothetical protein